MNAVALLLLAAVDLVADGRPQVHVETDASVPADRAAQLIRRHVVLMAGVALPAQGGGPALRFETTDFPGYAITLPANGGVLVAGDDPVRAAYDLLAAWGCRFDEPVAVVPSRKTLPVEATRRKRVRDLWVESERFDPSLPANGLATYLADYHVTEFEKARDLGYRVRVASTTFDDFLPPAHFAEHPDWFALRDGERTARGNFALRNASARAAFLDAVEAWLTKHPDVDRLGLWPEVTTVWDEDALALGAPEAYALLWREAAARFPAQKFEILATGLTLAPPAGRVPANVDVRLRPGRAASALQGIAGQEIDAVARAWEARGARVVLEIDAAPVSWCGMPWPCETAIRADAKRFTGAVLRHGRHAHARIWRRPDSAVPADRDKTRLLVRARSVRSWGHPKDAADLFFEESFGHAFHMAAIERLFRVAADESKSLEERRSAAGDVYLGYRSLERVLPAAYRRFRGREYQRVIEKLRPDGITHEVGPAKVKETFQQVHVETDRLRLVIDRDTATVTTLQVKTGPAWSEGKFFAVVGLNAKIDRTAGRVRISSPETGRVRIDLAGTLNADGLEWESMLLLSNNSGVVSQVAKISTGGGIGLGCNWRAKTFDHWVCPAYAREGKPGARAAFLMPAGTLFYCRAGPRGPGLAVRVRRRARVSLVGETLVAAGGGKELRVDWIAFTNPGELGK